MSEKSVNPDRRKLLSASVSTAVSVFFGGGVFADSESVQKAIEDFTGGNSANGRDALILDTPKIAENGHSVAISVTMASPMTITDYVESVMILADDNPNPEVAIFHFSPLSGEAKVSTRMRLARTQNVIAIAKLSDGSLHKASNHVDVTIGGCGSDA